MYTYEVTILNHTGFVLFKIEEQEINEESSADEVSVEGTESVSVSVTALLTHPCQQAQLSIGSFHGQCSSGTLGFNDL